MNINFYASVEEGCLMESQHNLQCVDRMDGAAVFFKCKNCCMEKTQSVININSCQQFSLI